MCWIQVLRLGHGSRAFEISSTRIGVTYSTITGGSARFDWTFSYGDCPKLLSIRGPIFRFLL